MFQIDLDVNRTYRDHDMFRDRYNSRQNALFHVLAAYSVYNTEVGYCQVRQKEPKNAKKSQNNLVDYCSALAKKILCRVLVYEI